MTRRRIISSITMVLALLMIGAFAGDVSAKSKLKKCPKSQSGNYHNCFGAHKFSDSSSYVGEWKNRKPHGQGTGFFSDGGKYIGEWQNGKRHGQGTVIFADGRKYVGEFKDNKFHGQGSGSYSDGNKYVGAWKNGRSHGHGTYSFANGNKYVGMWRNGLRHGHGTYNFSDGKKYVGESRRDKFSGQGALSFPSGNKYVGEFKDDRPDGQGTLSSPANGKYVGGFKNSKFNGHGIRYAANGTIIEQGIFKNGKLVKSETIEKKAQVAEIKPQQQAVGSSPELVFTTERKVALVIGNQAYEHATPLANPKNDATRMSAMLKRLGFEVVSGTDLGKQAMERKVREFARKSKQADLSLFFYAGHGIQVAGQNYLLPVDAEVKDATSLDFELVNVNVVSNYLGGLGKVGIILLDACRDNPLSRTLARSLGTRSSQVGRGLARISTPSGGLLVGFATAPGDVAADGQGTNSPFTAALLKHLPTPGVEIELLMKRVKAEVIRMTKNDQRPWHNSDLATEIYLAQKK